MKKIKKLKTVYIGEAELLIIAVIVHIILKTDTMYVNVPALIELKLQNMSTAELSAECGLSEQDAVSVQKEYKEGVAKIVFIIKTVLFKQKISSKSAA